MHNVAAGRVERFDVPTNGCRGTYRGTVSYTYGQNGLQLPLNQTGRTIPVGTFTLRVQ